MRGTRDRLLLQRKPEESLRPPEQAPEHESGLLNIERVEPNPCHDEVSILFTLDGPRSLQAVIYDRVGKEVERRDLGMVDRGSGRLRWTTAGIPAGIYYCRLVADGGATTASVVTTAER